VNSLSKRLSAPRLQQPVSNTPLTFFFADRRSVRQEMFLNLRLLQLGSGGVPTMIAVPIFLTMHPSPPHPSFFYFGSLTVRNRSGGSIYSPFLLISLVELCHLKSTSVQGLVGWYAS
jgi:hypothetical protein